MPEVPGKQKFTSSRANSSILPFKGKNETSLGNSRRREADSVALSPHSAPTTSGTRKGFDTVRHTSRNTRL
jgi:hypothetical protein